MTLRVNSQQQNFQQAVAEQSTVLNWIGKKVPYAFPEVVNNLNKIALPVIALVALSSLSVTEAGPLAYATCVSGCELACTQAGLFGAVASGGWSFLLLAGSTPLCATICGPILAAPSP